MDSVKISLVLLGLFCLLGACRKEEAPVQNITPPEYHPLVEGQVWHWLVMDTVFTENDTLAQQWYETDSFRTFFFGQNGVGILPKDVYRSDSISDTLFTYSHTESAYKAGQYQFEQVGNQPVAVLQLPPQAGVVWNAYAFTTKPQELRHMKPFNRQYEGIQQCLEVVLLLKNSSLIDLYDFKELYAPNIGRVYSWIISREYTYVDGSPVLVGGYTRERKRIGL
jgi:hypothetical protein